MLGYSHDTFTALLRHNLRCWTYSTIVFKTLENNGQNLAFNSSKERCYAK